MKIEQFSRTIVSTLSFHEKQRKGELCMNMHMHAFSLFDHISCCWYFFYQWPKYFQVVLSFHFTCRWLSLSLGKLVKKLMQKQDKKKTRFVDIFPCSFAVAFVYQLNQRAVAGCDGCVVWWCWIPRFYLYIFPDSFIIIIIRKCSQTFDILLVHGSLWMDFLV